MAEPKQEKTKLTTEQIKEEIRALDKVGHDQAKETMDLLVQRTVKEGILPKLALGLSDEMIETMYSHAFNLYNRGKYDDSAHMFRLLMLLDYTEAKFMMGLGACLHMKKDYENAAQTYIITSTLDTTNPLPWYHAADCYANMGTPSSAIYALRQAIEVAKDKPEFAVLVERSKMMIDSMAEASEKELDEFFGEDRKSKQAAPAKKKRGPKKKK